MNGAMLEVLDRTKAREALRHYASSCSCSSPVVVEELGRLLDKADAAGLASRRSRPRWHRGSASGEHARSRGPTRRGAPPARSDGLAVVGALIALAVLLGVWQERAEFARLWRELWSGEPE